MAVIQLALRVAQALTAMVVLGLSAYVANWYNMDTLTASPSQINFLIVAPLFALLSIGYLEVIPRVAPRASHPYASFGLEVLNVLFFFAGWIALAVFLSQLLFCRGSVCAAARATVVFAVGEQCLWIATAVFAGIEAFKGVRLARKPTGAAAMREKNAQMA